MLLGASFASIVAVIVGIGALRARGLLLAISTLAFAIAAQVYLFHRPFFTADFDRADPPRRHRLPRSPTRTAQPTSSC